MSEEIQWKKVSSKKYQRLTADGEWVSIEVNFGLTSLIFNEFIGEGGIIDPHTGAVATDLVTLISKFGKIGDLLLTEFDAQGEVKVKGNCRILDPTEVPILFEIAVDIINAFTKSISGIHGSTLVQETKAPTPKKAKA